VSDVSRGPTKGTKTSRSRLGLIAAGLVLAIGLVTALAAEAGTRGAKTTRVSVSSHEAQAESSSDDPAISADGRFVAFMSGADNLVPGDTNDKYDIFVRDRKMGRTELVSVSSSGEQGNRRSWSAAISANGRFVAIFSRASNLVRGDTNGVPDIFVHDRRTDTTERVSVSSAGAEANRHSYLGEISADGRLVAFSSKATNLVEGDTNGDRDAFVHDRRTGTTERVSVSSSGEQANRRSLCCEIAADGRIVAFSSEASNLVEGDTNGDWDAFVHDRVTDEISRVSATSTGGHDAPISAGSISADARFVAFSSAATDLVERDTNRRRDIFVHDRKSGRTERVSVSSAGAEADRGSGSYEISANGRFVAFSSQAGNLARGDAHRAHDVFVHDRRTGRTRLVSVSRQPQQSRYSLGPAISADGRFVAFYSESAKLVERDTNRRLDVFVRGPLRWGSR
jgi:Tol biopolymer transport system component